MPLALKKRKLIVTRKMLWIGVIFGVLYLFFEAVLHYSLFHGSGFAERVAAQDVHEILMHLLTVTLFIILGIYAGHITAKHSWAEKEIQQNYQIQSVFNQLLYIPLKNVSLEEMLKDIINCIVSVSWLGVESKGAIFLVEGEPKGLVLKAQQGLSPELQKICARVPFGKCLCGIAAASGEIVFADQVDERHTNQYEGMPSHGHYCVPIKGRREKLLGVINLYVPAGYLRNKRDEEFLLSVGNLLVGIIKRKKAEEELRVAYNRLQEMQDVLIQAEKLNAIGQLASGVAHEVRNPLGIVMQGINYLEKTISVKDKDAFETLSMIEDSTRRADRIIISLLDFSRATRLKLHPEDINVVLEKSLELVRAEFKDVEVIRETEKKLSKVFIDKNKLEQVFINVFLNAVQAMQKKGKLTVRSYEYMFKEGKPKVGKRKDDHFKTGEKVVIVEIEDNGIGISEENQKKVFDPFFTTKGSSEGSGLGLSVSRNIVMMHKGLIEIKSKVGKGTKVTITLKVARR